MSAGNRIIEITYPPSPAHRSKTGSSWSEAQACATFVVRLKAEKARPKIVVCGAV